MRFFISIEAAGFVGQASYIHTFESIHHLLTQTLLNHGYPRRCSYHLNPTTVEGCIYFIKVERLVYHANAHLNHFG